jgi:hypothetical protein
MTKRLSASLLCLGVALASAFAHAETTIVVQQNRVHLSDIVPGVAPGIADFDLGAAPPPGRNLFISRESLAEKLRMGGISAQALPLPKDGVRVQTESRSYSPTELEELVRGAVERAAPAGVKVTRLRVRDAQTLSLSIGTGQVKMPSVILKKGSQTQLAGVELLWGNQTLVFLPVELTMEVSEELLSTKVNRGSMVTLLVRRGPVEITALAELITSARIGETVQVRVGVTNKILTATLVGADRAEIRVKL